MLARPSCLYAMLHQRPGVPVYREEGRHRQTLDCRTLPQRKPRFTGLAAGALKRSGREGKRGIRMVYSHGFVFGAGPLLVTAPILRTMHNE